MNGATISEYLRQLCDDLDEGRSPARFPWRSMFTSLAAPAVVGVALTFGGCETNATPEPPPMPAYAVPMERMEDCSTSSDDDNDGLAGCADPDCQGRPPCIAPEPPTPPAGVVPPSMEEYAAPMPDRPPTPVPVDVPAGGLGEVCGDNVDNDGDGRTDCADEDCRSFVSCLPTLRYGAPTPAGPDSPGSLLDPVTR